MKVKITHARVMVPNQAEFLGGHTYDVSKELGSALVERGQAVEVESLKEDRDESPKAASKKASK